MVANTNNFRVHSPELKLTSYIKEFSIPSISFSHQEIRKSGMKAYLSADSIEYDSLSFDILLDDNYCTLLELYSYSSDIINNTFIDKTFTLIVDILKNGRTHLQFTFHGCRFSSIGSVNLDNNGELGESVNVSLVYNHFTCSRKFE